MVVKALSDPNHDREMEVKIDGSHFVTFSISHDLLPVSIEMTLHDCRGVFNFTNPGAISHNEILDLYKKYIDPSFTYTNFTLEEQAKILAAGRSNNELDSSKLVETCRQFGVEIPPIKESIVHVFERMQKNLGIVGVLVEQG